MSLCGGCGPVLEELHQLLAGFRDDVKCSEVHPILHGGEDAGLMLAVEGVGPVPGEGAGVSSLASANPPAAPAASPARPTPAAPSSPRRETPARPLQALALGASVSVGWSRRC